MALHTCTQLLKDNLALISLRLTFEGSPCPPEWGVISKTLIDLVNAIIHDQDWDAMTLFSLSSELVPSIPPLYDDIQFAKGKELIVDGSVNIKGRICVCNNDKIGHTVDIPV